MQKIFFILIFIVTLGFGATFEEGKKAFVSKDYEKAFEILNELAQRGVIEARNDSEAMYMLGYMYYNGKGAVTNQEKALEWHKKACNNGQKYSCEIVKISGFFEKPKAEQTTNSSNTSTTTTKQNNVKTEKEVTIEDAHRAYNVKDYKKALKIYEQLALKGDAKAQHSLGYMYHWGVGVDKNYSKAMELYKKACDNGYEVGCINSKNFTEKLKSQQATNSSKTTTTATTTKQNNVNTEKKVTIEDAHKAYNVKDYKKALKIYEQLALKGDAKAQYALGSMYDSAKGVVQDYKKTLYWYEKASNQGLVQAQNSLGDMYYWGTGVDKDYKKAVNLYEKAANQGLALAQENLGYIYRDAIGVDKDNKKAVEWFDKACAQGRADSCKSAKELTEKIKAQEVEKNIQNNKSSSNQTSKQPSDLENEKGSFLSLMMKVIFGVIILVSIVVMFPKYLKNRKIKYTSATPTVTPTPTVTSAPIVKTPPSSSVVECVNCGSKHTNPTSSLCSSCGKDMYKKDTNIKCTNCGLEYDAKETSCNICGHENQI